MSDEYNADVPSTDDTATNISTSTDMIENQTNPSKIDSTPNTQAENWKEGSLISDQCNDSVSETGPAMSQSPNDESKEESSQSKDESESKVDDSQDENNKTENTNDEINSNNDENNDSTLNNEIPVATNTAQSIDTISEANESNFNSPMSDTSKVSNNFKIDLDNGTGNNNSNNNNDNDNNSENKDESKNENDDNNDSDSKAEEDEKMDTQTEKLKLHNSNSSKNKKKKLKKKQSKKQILDAKYKAKKKQQALKEKKLQEEARKKLKKKGLVKGKNNNKHNNKKNNQVVNNSKASVKYKKEMKNKKLNKGSKKKLSNADTPIKAVISNDLSKIKQFVQLISSMLNQSDRSKSNVLHHCCRLGRHEILDYLLNCNQLSPGLINTQNQVGNTPLLESIQHINHSDSVDEKGNYDETSEMALNKFKCFQLLLKIGFKNKKLKSNIEIKNNRGLTALTSAVIQNDVKIVNVLLVHKPRAQIDVLTRSKKTGLMIAVEKNYHEIAISLLNAGARYDIKDKFGNSAKTQAKGEVLKLIQKIEKETSNHPLSLKSMKSSPNISYNNGNYSNSSSGSYGNGRGRGRGSKYSSFRGRGGHSASLIKSHSNSLYSSSISGISGVSNNTGIPKRGGASGRGKRGGLSRGGKSNTVYKSKSKSKSNVTVTTKSKIQSKNKSKHKSKSKSKSKHKSKHKSKSKSLSKHKSKSKIQSKKVKTKSNKKGNVDNDNDSKEDSDDDSKDDEKSDSKEDKESKYIEAMHNLEPYNHYCAISGLCDRSVYKTYKNSAVNNPSNFKKVLKEIKKTLPKNIHVGWNGSMFIRFDEDNPRYLQAILTGLLNTPYANGCFLFDIYLSDNYPTKACNIQHITKGATLVKANNGPGGFSPNLHKDTGKVCLSLLGTWSTGAQWDPKVSNVYQVLSTILFMIFSAEHPYYMEPSYGGWEGTAPKKKHNKRVIEYDEEVYVGTVKYAMLGMLETPPKGFEDVIKMHFKLKKNEIIKTVEKKWLAKASATCKAKLKPVWESLKKQLNKLDDNKK